jgi:septum formation protein
MSHQMESKAIGGTVPKISFSDYSVILGSASPRRQSLFKLLFPDFKTITTDNELVAKEDDTPLDFVKNNAIFKAEGIRSENELSQTEVLFTFDTVVYVDGQILGKPEDDADAVRMLKMLSGRPHCVATGYAVYNKQGLEFSDADVTKVTFSNLSQAEIDAYLETREHTDKAGAYGIQGTAGKLISGIEGCWFNVVGLPVSKVYQQLKQMGFYSF